MEGVDEMRSEKWKDLRGYELEESKQQCEEQGAHRCCQARNVQNVQGILSTADAGPLKALNEDRRVLPD